MIDTILLATTNKKKIVELRPSFETLGVKLLSLSDLLNPIEVDETGTTFLENARLKAIAQAKHHHVWALGEDSGLCVSSLGGEPGVYSARYAGIGAGDEANNDRLLRELKGKSSADRAAYYVSTMSLASPEGKILVEAEGRCWGRILETRRGVGGFGYDPLFEIPEYHQTFAELGLTVKTVLSHRGRALRAFLARFSNAASA
jgi:XTP/dITP diphosphohydrolase